jgi:hypothetical protein
MSTELQVMDAPQLSAEIAEKVLAQGKLELLTPGERVQYYMALCESLGLNPATRPFEYIVLSGSLRLYARKDATEQLRRKYGVSITRVTQEIIDGILTVTAYARTATGREDADIGCVALGNLAGEARANAYMKAHTKAKRRVTLSICGLGMLDSTEVETIPGAGVVVDMATGELTDAPQRPPQAPQRPQEPSRVPGRPAPHADVEVIPGPGPGGPPRPLATEAQVKRLYALAGELGWGTSKDAEPALARFGVAYFRDLRADDAADLISELSAKAAELHEPATA